MQGIHLVLLITLNDDGNSHTTLVISRRSPIYRLLVLRQDLFPSFFVLLVLHRVMIHELLLQQFSVCVDGLSNSYWWSVEFVCGRVRGGLFVRNVLRGTVDVGFYGAAVLVVAGILSWGRLVGGLAGVHGADCLVLHGRGIGNLMGRALGDVVGVVVIHLSVGYLSDAVRLVDYTRRDLK